LASDNYRLIIDQSSTHLLTALLQSVLNTCPS